MTTTMNKREAKRWACRCAWELLSADQSYGFLQGEGPDAERKRNAWNELVEELARRGFSHNEPTLSEEQNEKWS